MDSVGSAVGVDVDRINWTKFSADGCRWRNFRTKYSMLHDLIEPDHKLDRQFWSLLFVSVHDRVFETLWRVERVCRCVDCAHNECGDIIARDERFEHRRDCRNVGETQKVTSRPPTNSRFRER